MWIVATITSRRTMCVWLREDIRAKFVPGMYVLKGETNLKHLGHAHEIKLQHLDVPVSYFRKVDIQTWLHYSGCGFPIPFEFHCVPVLVDSVGQWVDPHTNACTYALTQNTTKRTKINLQGREQAKKFPNIARDKRTQISCQFSEDVEVMFAAKSRTMLPFCDAQLRKLLLVWPIDDATRTLTQTIYCNHDDCSEYLPCSKHHGAQEEKEKTHVKLKS